VDFALDGFDGLKKLADSPYDFVFCNISVRKINVLLLLEKAAQMDISALFIMISGSRSLKSAYKCMNAGAFGFISKLMDDEEVFALLKKAGEFAVLKSESRRLRGINSSSSIHSLLRPVPEFDELLLCDRDLSIKRAEETMERTLIGQALQRTDGNRTHAAKLLEISLRSLLYKIKEYGIE
jgi:DNA-binding NtrC family response regulator